MELYSPRERSERVVAMSRLVLASCSLLAVWLDPTEVQQYGFVVRALLTTYVLYSAVIAALSGLSMAPAFLDRLPNHVVDLATVSGVVLLSAGSSCPLLPLFIFVLLEASLRWHRRGTVWAAIGTLGVFAVIGGYQRWAQPASFELNEFLIRCASLVVIAIVLDQVGTYERQLRRHVHALATEVDAPLDETDRLVSALLEWAARIVDAPRAVLAWEEPDEPWLYLATWQRGKYRLVNVARHAEASAARLDMAVEDDQVNIAISDDGRGFSFKGLYDHATLAALELGPVTLKERLARLGGSVSIDSSPGATRLQITFPVGSQVA